jgi:serralysin
LADYGRASDPSDFLNSGVQGPHDPFNEFYSSNTVQQLTAVDLQQLDALGFHLTSNAPVVIEAFGSTSLLRAVNNDYFLVPVGGSSGPSVKYGGAPVTAGQFDPWAPIGAEQTADGYQIAWKMEGADQFTVWHTDSDGNYLWTDIGVVSGSSATLEALEPSFQQDLNNDGTIGVPTNAGSGPVSLALLTSHLAATFVPPAAEGAGPVAAAQPSD